MLSNGFKVRNNTGIWNNSRNYIVQYLPRAPSYANAR